MAPGLQMRLNKVRASECSNSMMTGCCTMTEHIVYMYNNSISPWQIIILYRLIQMPGICSYTRTLWWVLWQWPLLNLFSFYFKALSYFMAYRVWHSKVFGLGFFLRILWCFKFNTPSATNSNFQNLALTFLPFEPKINQKSSSGHRQHTHMWSTTIVGQKGRFTVQKMM